MNGEYRASSVLTGHRPTQVSLGRVEVVAGARRQLGVLKGTLALVDRPFGQNNEHYAKRKSCVQVSRAHGCIRKGQQLQLRHQRVVVHSRILRRNRPARKRRFSRSVQGLRLRWLVQMALWIARASSACRPHCQTDTPAAWSCARALTAATSSSEPVRMPNGPFLVVGVPASNGYVFGLRGWVEF